VQLPGTAEARKCKHAAINLNRLLYDVAEQQPEDSEAGHLLELVKIQAVTRREAKKAT
jgi:hypothetical protein